MDPRRNEVTFKATVSLVLDRNQEAFNLIYQLGQSFSPEEDFTAAEVSILRLSFYRLYGDLRQSWRYFDELSELTRDHTVSIAECRETVREEVGKLSGDMLTSLKTRLRHCNNESRVLYLTMKAETKWSLVEFHVRKTSKVRLLFNQVKADLKDAQDLARTSLLKQHLTYIGLMRTSCLFYRLNSPAYARFLAQQTLEDVEAEAGMAIFGGPVDQESLDILEDLRTIAALNDRDGVHWLPEDPWQDITVTIQ